MVNRSTRDLQHKKNRNETDQTTSDDKDEGINLLKEKMDVGRNDEEKFGPNENITGERDIGEDDKPPRTDDISEDDDKAAEEAANEPYTEPRNKLTMQHKKRVSVSPIGVAASEDHDVTRIDQQSTESGELCEKPNEGVADAKTHDRERTPEPISSSTPHHRITTPPTPILYAPTQTHPAWRLHAPQQEGTMTTCTPTCHAGAPLPCGTRMST
jgi:hypothetical protein